MTRWIDVVKEDLASFRAVHPQKGWFKYLYYPDFRTVIVFRLSQMFYSIRPLRPLAYFLTVVNDLVSGVWIGPRVQVGPGLYLGHPRGLVVNPDTRIGRKCSIMQRVTIGGPKVLIGDYVEIGANATIVSNRRGRGRLSIGNHSIIGAGAVVVADVPDCSVAVGNPARVVKRISPEDNWLAFRQWQGRTEARGMQQQVSG